MQTRNWIPILATLLVAQVALAGVLGWTGDDGGVFRSEEPLLAFDPEQVEEIRIEEGENQVVLRKQEAAWRLPDHHGFAADAYGVNRLLKQLAEVEKGWPVAKTAAAAKRFNVTEDGFQRRIALSTDGKGVVDLLLGTSPGFRKVHAREAASDEIHAVELGQQELSSAKLEDWIDYHVLHRKPAELARLEVGEIELERSGEDWLVANLEDDHETVLSESRPLVEQVTKLRIVSVLGTEPKPEYRLDSPELRIVFHPSQGEPVTYTVSKPEEGAQYVLKSSASPHYVLIAGYTMTPILEYERGRLVQARISEEPSADEAADAGGAAVAD